MNGTSQWLALGENRDWLRCASVATLSVWIKPRATNDIRSIIAISVNNGSAPTGSSRACLESNDDYLVICGRGSGVASRHCSGDMAKYTMNSCSNDCLDSDPPACTACRDLHCRPAFEVCTG